MKCKDCGTEIKGRGYSSPHRYATLCGECEVEEHIREYEVAQANDGGY